MAFRHDTLTLTSDNPNHKEKLWKLFTMKQNEKYMVQNRGFNSNNSIYYSLNTDNLRWELNTSYTFFSGEQTFEDFLIYRDKNFTFPNRLSFSSLYERKDPSMNEKKSVAIIYLETSGKNSDFSPVHKILNTYQKLDILILVYEQGVCPDKVSFSESLQGIDTIMISDINLAHNVLQHALAPINYRYIPPEQVQQWASQNQPHSIQFDKMPRIFDQDPYSIMIGARPYGIIETEVLSPTLPTAGFARFVSKKSFSSTRKK